MNWYGNWALFRRECQRFLWIWLQTLGAPLVSAMLYFAIFGGALGQRIGEAGDGITYLQFLTPGLAAMGIIQHAFQNTSSSLIQMKYLGMLQADLLALPLKPVQIVFSFTAAAVLRGVLVGAGTLLIARLFITFGIAKPVLLIGAALVMAAISGLLGLLTGIWARSFDQVALVGNFILTPMVYLGGVFFANAMLPAGWQRVPLFNPVFYLVDLFRQGVLGVGQTQPESAILAVSAVLTGLFALAVVLFRTGWRLKN
ncbi:MAG: ABC transporter permease [Magnetococcales bacterium]|nr:ABC transporter permease [Magnetococcales bacterium]